MPELAEVEFYRKQWQAGIGKKIVEVHLHPATRIFRGTDTRALSEALDGAKLVSSEAHGKQMLFRFSGDSWLGIHLGMSGKLRAERGSYASTKHDHLVLRQAHDSLVFSDPRQFGRVLFHQGTDAPKWWQKLPPRIGSPEFTRDHFSSFLQRHSKAPIKAVLLNQSGFPGVGNWMADEILWQAKILPHERTCDLNRQARERLYEKTLWVCEEALRTIGRDFSDPPADWLFRYRWKAGADCPRCGTPLKRAAVGGRTSCWCPKCQR